MRSLLALNTNRRLNQLVRFHQVGSLLVVTLTSQASSAVGLLLLQLLGARLADVYSASIQAGSASMTGIVYGVLYNVAIGRPNFSEWGRWKQIAAGFSIVLSLITAYSIVYPHSLTDSSYRVTVLIVFCFGLGGAFLAASAVVAVKRACMGAPLSLASISLGPNIVLALATGATLLLENMGYAASVLPAVAWMFACFAQALIIGRIALPSFTQVESPPMIVPDRQAEHTAALSLGVITSSVIPVFSLNALAHLAPRHASLVFLVNRVGSSAVTTGVNTILLARYNWTSDHHVTGLFAAWANIASGVMTLLAIILSSFLHLELFGYWLVGASWLLLILVTQPVLREINARRLSRIITYKVASDCVFASLATLILVLHPSITGYFAVIMVSQSVTTGICSFGLANRSLALASGFSLAASMLLVLNGW